MATEVVLAWVPGLVGGGAGGSRKAAGDAGALPGKPRGVRLGRMKTCGYRESDPSQGVRVAGAGLNAGEPRPCVVGALDRVMVVRR